MIGRKRYYLLAGFAALLVGLILVIRAFVSEPKPLSRETPTGRYLAGATYSLDYPETFETGYLRGTLEPPQEPSLGRYSSLDSGVLEKHIQWVSHHGIDFLILEYDPRHLQRVQLFLKSRNLEDIRFCFSYPANKLTTSESADDLQKIRSFQKHPFYLTQEDKPVLLLQECAELDSTKLRSAIEKLRAEGEMYLLGDELRAEITPKKERVSLFDAVTGIGFYDESKAPKKIGGYGVSSELLSRLTESQAALSDSGASDVPIVPGLIPGYNRRVNDLNSGVIPRLWQPDGKAGSTQEELFEQYALPALKDGAPLLILESFNKWGNDTAVEPLAPATPTTLDKSGGQQYTDGYLYRSFGEEYLQLLQGQLFSVCGTVRGENGTRLSGVQVTAWRSGKTVANDITDSRGRFHLSRKTLGPGDYLVGVTPLESIQVRVEDESPAEALELKLTTEEPAQKPERSLELSPTFPELRNASLSALPVKEYEQLKWGAFRLYVHKPPTETEKWLHDSAGLPKSVERVIKKHLKEGDTVVDTGAGIGTFSLVAAQQVGDSGTVYSFEHDTVRFQQLVANQKLNGLEQLQPYWYELAKETAPPQTTNASEQRSLDSFQLGAVKLLRIDLKDREKEILQGARRLLQESRPVVLLTIHGSSEDSSESMEGRIARTRGLLASLGYRLTPLEAKDVWLAYPLDIETNSENQVYLNLGSSWAREYLVRGFSKDEEQWPDNWVWNEEIETETWLFLEKIDPTDYVLGFRAQAFSLIAPVDAQVYLNGANLGSVRFESDFRGLELSVPDGLLKRGRNVLTLRFNKTGTPALLMPGSGDQRFISVRFDCLWLVPKI